MQAINVISTPVAVAPKANAQRKVAVHAESVSCAEYS
jgi:hypothetical protein